MTTPVTGKKQCTLAGPASVEGVGLFTAAEARATILPAEPGSGIRFRRIDLAGAPEVRATFENVSEAPRHTVLSAGEASVQTIEHCLGALAGMGIDNAIVELTGPELPALDGSASPFVEAIVGAGIVEQEARREPIVIGKPITVRNGEATLTASPNDSATLELEYTLDYAEASPIGHQSHAFSLDDGSFTEGIAPARTFSTEAEARAGQQMGLFRHLTPHDMLVIGEAGPIDNAYRFDNEPARHKLLDLLGDISLAGRPIHGRVVAFRSGHALNHKLAQAIVEADQGVSGKIAEQSESAT